MLYRRMKSSGDDLSILGFGCMRFPLDEAGNIHRSLSEEMLSYAIENGVNYIDTAWPYHKGESEPFVGEFLEKKGVRKNIKLATKLPSWLIQSHDDMETYLNRQLERLRTDYIDYYLVHALNRDYWENLKDKGLFSFLDRIKREGRVRNVGFSFHDTLDVFKDIIDSYPWDFCQIQYNYLDTHFQAGQAGLDYAGEKGIGVVIMEPLRGGKIAGRHPEEVDCILNSLEKEYSSAEWALRWVFDSEKVVTVLSGMSTLEQLTENISTSSKAMAGDLSLEEREAFKKIRNLYLSRIKANCTECQYCMPCPSGVAIPTVLRFYNETFIFDDAEKSMKEYNQFIGEESKAHNCIQCGKCENLCPQNIEIIKHLQEAVKLFGG